MLEKNLPNYICKSRSNSSVYFLQQWISLYKRFHLIVEKRAWRTQTIFVFAIMVQGCLPLTGDVPNVRDLQSFQHVTLLEISPAQLYQNTTTRANWWRWLQSKQRKLILTSLHLFGDKKKSIDSKKFMVQCPIMISLLF